MFHRKSEEYKELTAIFRCVGALSGGTTPATTQQASPRLELPGKAPEGAILRPSVQWWRSARSLDLLPRPSRAGRRRTREHDLVPRAQGRRSHGRHLVSASADMDLPGIRVGRRGYGLTGGHRVGPAAAPRRAAHPAGERPGCLPYAPGG